MLWVSPVAADAALETTLATISYSTISHAVESRLPYIRRFKGTRALTGEGRVAERLTYFEFVDTQAADERPRASTDSSQPGNTG
jgi:hypothetical protein